ncbi:hypothetical protein [Collimonas arenae]|uniref:hypothetical protein n=1 Tax=Collimonas arenae TaxID=279058 RepID=UPI000FE14864|nr:hypothetical protein [Collimonas arenae]
MNELPHVYSFLSFYCTGRKSVVRNDLLNVVDLPNFAIVHYFGRKNNENSFDKTTPTKKKQIKASLSHPNHRTKCVILRQPVAADFPANPAQLGGLALYPFALKAHHLTGRAGEGGTAPRRVCRVIFLSR